MVEIVQSPSDFRHTREHCRRTKPGQFKVQYEETPVRPAGDWVNELPPEPWDMDGGSTSVAGDEEMDELLYQIEGVVEAKVEQAVAKVFVLLGPLYKAMGVEVPGTMKLVWADETVQEIAK